MLFRSQEYTPLGTWPTDNILIGEVQKALDSTEQQDFIYTITVQGHGAYPAEQVIKNPEITGTGASDEAKNNEWEYYVNQLHEVDKFIADLIDMLSARDEKTMVVFFGDHLPTMGLTNEDMKSGDIFKTKYATWNNFGAEKVSQDLTSYQLLASITDQANIHEGTMFSFHQNHNYNITDDYSKDMELLQYDILCGKRYAYHGKDLYPASMLQMGVQDITADRLEEQSDGLHIYGANYTKWSKVFVNGVKVPTSFLSDTELVISMGDLKEGTNVLTVNQMGSSDTIFRSSNEISYLIPITPDTKPVVPVDDTIEETPSSIDRAVNSERNETTSEELDSQITSPASSEEDTTKSEQ